MDRDAQSCVQLYWMMLPDLISSLVFCVTRLRVEVTNAVTTLALSAEVGMCDLSLHV